MNHNLVLLNVIEIIISCKPDTWFIGIHPRKTLVCVHGETDNKMQMLKSQIY